MHKGLIVARDLIAQAEAYGAWNMLAQNYRLRVSPAFRYLRSRADEESFRLRVPTRGGLSVHILVCEKDVLLAIWALASFVGAYGPEVSIHFHDDGSLSRASACRLISAFPSARVINCDAADGVATKKLRELPLSRVLRQKCFMLRKFFDPMWFGEGTWRLLLDSDVIFFSEALEIQNASSLNDGPSLFNRDISSSYCIDPKVAERLIGRPIVQNINAGLSLVNYRKIDLSLADGFLEACEFVKKPWLIEQTLHALYASKTGVELLGGGYDLSCSRWAKRDAISKHYVGRMTEMFFIDGVQRVRKRLLAHFGA